jgi:hypothetical protein
VLIDRADACRSGRVGHVRAVSELIPMSSTAILCHLLPSPIASFMSMNSSRPGPGCSSLDPELYGLWLCSNGIRGV